MRRSAAELHQADLHQQNVDGQDAVAQFSLREVSQHSQPDDCWVIVRGYVYDVSSFVPRHPGGNLITVKAGKDITQLFDAYHPLAAR